MSPFLIIAFRDIQLAPQSGSPPGFDDPGLEVVRRLVRGHADRVAQVVETLGAGQLLVPAANMVSSTHSNDIITMQGNKNRKSKSTSVIKLCIKVFKGK